MIRQKRCVVSRIKKIQYIPVFWRLFLSGSLLSIIFLLQLCGDFCAARETNMEIRCYSSSMDPALKLSAEFYVPVEPKPLCLFFHGWHMTAAGSAAAGYITNLTPYFFVVNVDMRGRGKNTGKPDANGFELIDALDALRFARQTWPQAINTNEAPKLVGGSGGGGNVLALVGKAPDLFSSAISWAGMSDYALWHEGDKAGRYRDEMDTKGWIGGTPSVNPAGYRARGGLYLVENELTPLLVIHGRNDGAVPVIHAEKYKEKSEQLGKTQIQFLFNNRGHASEQWPEIIAYLKSHSNAPLLSREGVLRVHSFVACRAFWLILDEPGKMGTANYRLDANGRLCELKFMPDTDASPHAFTLRLFDKPGTVTVTRPSDKITLSPCGSAEDYGDYHWDGNAPWMAIINYGNEKN